MQTARIFISGNSQAVRLPKDFRFEEDEVVIKRVGRIVMLFPKKYRAEDLLETLQAIGPMGIEREQPPQAETRTSLD
ncbi:MAG: AbrB/MazE/SpoVT family DNA-binding domain-containing protein [Betaproteobacteria bacterium]|nr:AbrB/MazE/SpoVT family DNA-binding domain-containing protein [Betaproteobacteria bacterium]